jgi:hypothetical protein
MGVIEMNYLIVEEIKDELRVNDKLDFLEYLGIDYEDFEEFNESIDFDDCSA